MSQQSPLARVTLLFIVLMSLIPQGSAVEPVASEGEFPERGLADPVEVYIWNMPLKLVLLNFVFIVAPLLFFPVQSLMTASTWLYLGHRRISRKNALEHETRRAAYLCIQDNPGINHASLSRKLGVNVGTLKYHLATLCETGKILAKHDRGLLRYYTNKMVTRERKAGEGHLDGTRKRILGLLMQDPGMTRKDVASALGIAGASVTWHMELLIQGGAVRSEKDGKMVRYFPRWDVLRHSRTDGSVDATG